ncbi:sensor histidine kinase [Paenibacillus mesophilus]|uniref:sensor histidine kinase n=1 Tax=Paenibacillus mesophilus TaxID=2582849 RepID=UPI00110F3061|nr:sensor histidine kinase [Paenibacillus mesophilus]TMV50034.1 sensor histidine kinase [Paenibacillus mesophilus]
MTTIRFGLTGLFRNMNVKNKLLLLFFLIGLIPVLFIALIFYRQSTRAFEEELSKYTVEIAKQAGGRLDSFVQEMERVANIVRFDSDVQTVLHGSGEPIDPGTVHSIRAVRNFFDSIGNFRSYLKGIYLVTDSGILVYNGSGEVARLGYSFQEDDWYRQIVRQPQFRLNPVHPQSYVRDEPVVTFSLRLMDIRDFATKGTLLFDFSPTIIREMSETIQLGRTGYVFMMTEDGNHVIPSRHSLSWLKEDERLKLFRGKQSGHFMMKAAGEKLLVGFHTSAQTGWKIVGVVPFDELATEMQTIRLGIFLAGIAAVIVIIVLSTALSRMITRPLQFLESKMRTVERGNFDVAIELKSRDEFGRLGIGFNRMVSELNRMKNEVFMAEVREYRHQLLRKDSEMKALQAQINPHFLYNTLNVIVCIAEVYEAEEIVSVSQSLSHMFKYSISGSSMTTLEDEIGHLNAYLSIVQIRFPGRFRVDWNVDPELLPYPVMKLMFQPIVENAVTHAFLNGERTDLITITASRGDGYVMFRIEDDGIGIEEERLRQIRVRLEAEEPDFHQPKEHIGLENVKMRLRMVYRDRIKLQLRSRVGEGTSVEIAIREGEDDGVSCAAGGRRILDAGRVEEGD